MPPRHPESEAAAAHDVLPMLDVYLPMMKSAAIISANDLGLFAALADGPCDLPELARKLDVDAGALERLATFLAAQDYLERRGSLYANSAFVQRWFTRRGEVDYSSGLAWTGVAWQLMAELSDAVRSGQPKQNLWDRMVEQPALGGLFSRYMHAFAEHLTPDLLRHVPLPPSAHRLLDLGGSHGLHSISFCTHYPDLEAVIVDLASALNYTGDLIVQHGLQDRVQMLPGDLMTVDWGNDYDVVFCLSVAHNQSEADNERIMKRIASSLRPGGVLVIHEYLASTSDETAYYAAFNLTLLTETATRIYSQQEISGWLTRAGFSRIRRVDLEPREKGSLILAWL